MKLLYITNIPTPYRQSRFNLLSKILQENGIKLEVLYMAQIESNRNWTIPIDSFQYNYKIYKGIHPTFGGMFAHFNPGLLIRLLKNDYKYAIIGGMSSPTHLLAPFFIQKDKTKVMSVESNLFSVKRTKGLAAWLKKILLKKVDAYQVTGTPQINYIKYFIGNFNKPIIKLPNLIDDKIFSEKILKIKINKTKLRSELEIADNNQVWIIPARLHQEKGLIEFLEVLKDVDNFKDVKIFILGTGPLETKIRDYVSIHNLPVTLVGFVQQDIAIKYYAISDLFVLPSLKDPSPLTPIEACAASLPLLVSNRIGNLEDVLADNGWSYDPKDSKENLIKLFNEVIKMSNSDLSKVGVISKSIYNQKFNNLRCLNYYVKSIIKL